MLKLVVLASGNGSNFEAIAKAIENNQIDAQIELLITDNEKARVRIRAEKFGIRHVFINSKKFRTSAEFNVAIADAISDIAPDLIVFAGYMRIVSEMFIARFENKIINIHPSLLPKFKGLNAIKRAYMAKETVTGVTVHFVSNEVDSGPIIKQHEVKIPEGISLDELTENIHTIEHFIYPEVIGILAKSKKTKEY